MKRKILSFLLILTLIVSSVHLLGMDLNLLASASTTDKISGDFSYVVYSDNTVSIIAYLGNDVNVTIPDYIDGMPVTMIEGFSCIDGVEDNLECVIMPDTIDTISYRAFKNRKKLKEIHFSENLVFIGQQAFYGCDSLKEINLPSFNNVDYDNFPYAFGYEPFANSGLEKVNLSAEMVVFPSGLLDYTNVKSIILPKSVTMIQKDAFKYSVCETIIIEGVLSAENISGMNDTTSYVYNSSENGFVDTIMFKCVQDEMYMRYKYRCGFESDINCWVYQFYEKPNAEKYIFGDYEYYINENSEAVITKYNGTAESLSIPERIEGYPVTEICLYAFEYATFSYIELPSTLRTIAYGAFADCINLKKITIPESVTEIESYAFSQCDFLETVNYPPIRYVNWGAFFGCDSLKNFNWNTDQKFIGVNAFAHCANLKDFDFVGIEDMHSSSFSNSGINVANLGEAKNVESSQLTTIEVQSFKNCENLQSVGIGGNVTTIKSQAFADCSNLEMAVIADSVTEIADDAFDGCDKLTIYCSQNSYAHSYAQTQDIKVSAFIIAPIPNQTYTGFAIEPEISVSVSGDELTENIDFGVTYANNINVGNADVTVKGKGDFRMFASKAKFTIVTKNISAATVTPIADQSYTGLAITPRITVNDGVKVLREGTDYTVTYANNINEGTATAKITGIGNYSGTTSTDFQISKETGEVGYFQKIISTISVLFVKIISFFVSRFI